jgi:hypothetical protein
MARFSSAIKTTAINNMTTTEENSSYVASEDVNASTGFTVTYPAYNAVNQAFNTYTVWVQPMKKPCDLERGSCRFSVEHVGSNSGQVQGEYTL